MWYALRMAPTSIADTWPAIKPLKSLGLVRYTTFYSLYGLRSRKKPKFEGAIEEKMEENYKSMPEDTMSKLPKKNYTTLPGQNMYARYKICLQAKLPASDFHQKHTQVHSLHQQVVLTASLRDH